MMSDEKTPYQRDQRSRALINRDAAALSQYKDRRRLMRQLATLEQRVTLLENLLRQDRETDTE